MIVAYLFQLAFSVVNLRRQFKSKCCPNTNFRSCAESSTHSIYYPFTNVESKPVTIFVLILIGSISSFEERLKQVSEVHVGYSNAIVCYLNAQVNVRAIFHVYGSDYVNFYLVVSF